MKPEKELIEDFWNALFATKGEFSSEAAAIRSLGLRPAIFHERRQGLVTKPQIRTLLKLRECPHPRLRETARALIERYERGRRDLESYRASLSEPVAYARTNYSWGSFAAVFGENTVEGNLIGATADMLWSSACGEFFEQNSAELKATGSFFGDDRFPMPTVISWAQRFDFYGKDEEYFRETLEFGEEWDVFGHWLFWEAPWDHQSGLRRKDVAPDPANDTPAVFEDFLGFVTEVAHGRREWPIGAIADFVSSQTPTLSSMRKWEAGTEPERLTARIKFAAHAASISRRVAAAALHLCYETDLSSGGERVVHLKDVWRYLCAVEASRWRKRWQMLLLSFGEFQDQDIRASKRLWLEIEEEFVLDAKELGDRREGQIARMLDRMDSKP